MGIGSPHGAIGVWLEGSFLVFSRNLLVLTYKMVANVSLSIPCVTSRLHLCHLVLDRRETTRTRHQLPSLLPLTSAKPLLSWSGGKRPPRKSLEERK